MGINQNIWHNLEKAIEKGKLSHAYLFCGPKGTGRFEMIKKVFLSINREKYNQAGGLVIVVEAEVEEKKDKIRVKDISAEKAREAIKKAGYFAPEGKKKFLIIKDADRLTSVAANSLLKIIEEPKKDTLIFILAEKEESLLLTIRSRCQKIFFNLSSAGEVSDYLKNNFPQLDQNVIEEAASYSRGRYRLAIDLANDRELLKKKKEDFEIFKKTIKSDWAQALKAIEDLSKDREALLELIEEWVWSLRDFMKDAMVNGSNRKIQAKVLVMIKDLLEVKSKIQNSNASEKIQLENFFIKTI